MTKRELILSITITGFLILTTSFIIRNNQFDCHQPLFSSTSSCSLLGMGSCVSVQSQAGVINFWNNMEDVFGNKPLENIRCMPGCSINNGKVTHGHDSVNQTP